MKKTVNNILLDELNEAHTIFETFINEIKKNDLVYSCEKVINLENTSYRIAYDAITRMQDVFKKYESFKDNNNREKKKDLIEKYNENYEIARREISYIFSLDRRLNEEMSIAKPNIKK